MSVFTGYEYIWIQASKGLSMNQVQGRKVINQHQPHPPQAEAMIFHGTHAASTLPRIGWDRTSPRDRPRDHSRHQTYDKRRLPNHKQIWQQNKVEDN